MAELGFFGAARQPYYISCSNYDRKSAGVKALHHLCHALNELGAEAYLLGCSEESKSLRTPLLKASDVLRHQQAKLTPIIIYPEVIKGNPFNIPNVVRWLLNKPGHLGGESILDNDELMFAYAGHFIPENMSMPILCIPVIDITIFNNINNPYDDMRRGSCFYAHKYLRHGGKLTEHVEGAQSLCLDINLTPHEIAEILRKSEVLYCYEPSAIVTEALLCGCPVVMVPSDYLTENSSGVIRGDGIAFGTDPDQIEYAQNTVHKVTQNNQALMRECWAHVKDFIAITESIFPTSSETQLLNSNEWVDNVLEFLANSDEETAKNIKPRRRLNDKQWLVQNTLTEGQATIMAERMHYTWLHHPTFHLIMIVNPDELVLLSDTLESLQQQLYSAWGLSIISTIPQPDFLADLPENIEWLQLGDSSLNETINKTVNETGLEWVLQLLPGDTLFPQALWSFSDCINQHVEYRFIYSDEMQKDSSTQLLFKPDFNLELLRASSYIGRSAIIRRDSFEEIGGYTGLAYVDITDLAFHVYETWGKSVIGHIADVLYSAIDIHVDQEKVSENELAVRVAHIERLSIDARVLRLAEHGFQIKHLSDTSPLVSVVIANKNNASAIVAAVKSLHLNTDYNNYELLIVDQMSDIEDMAYIYDDFKELFGSKFTLLSYQEANYSAAINYGVSQAKGEYVVVLSSFVMPVNDFWLKELVSRVQYDDIGVVGVKVVEASEPFNVVHAGGVLGISNDISGLFFGIAHDDDGYMNRAQLAQEYAFVSSAAYIVNKAKFISVSGLDEGQLANTHYCVTDFCLKIKEAGFTNIWTPHAVFKQEPKLSQAANGISDFDNTGAEDIILQRWNKYVKHDAAFNRNLSLMHADYSVQNKVLLNWREQNDNRPRVMAFPFSQGAVGEFRTRAPLNYLAKEGLVETCYLPTHENIISPFIPSKCEVIRAQPDIFYLNNTLQDEHFAFLQWLKSETNTFVVFSLDDLIISLPKKNDANNLLHKDIRHRLRRTLALCDRLIVSTQPLAAAFADYCSDIVVVPNSIDMARWSTVMAPPVQKREKLRVGWAGGELHRGDLDMIVDLVKETSQVIDWVFMGMCPEGLKPYLHEFHAFSSFSEYPEKMAELDLDLAIAPLEVNPFNEAKSNLRLLEYGILGWPVICTDIFPYQTSNPPVVRVENTKAAWLQAIYEAISEPELLKIKGEELQKWVVSNYLLDHHAETWLKALTKR